VCVFVVFSVKPIQHFSSGAHREGVSIKISEKNLCFCVHRLIFIYIKDHSLGCVLFKQQKFPLLQKEVNLVLRLAEVNRDTPVPLREQVQRVFPLRKALEKRNRNHLKTQIRS
jgi:hypothetical protein